MTCEELSEELWAVCCRVLIRTAIEFPELRESLTDALAELVDEYPEVPQ
jgi:hypothetical protein